METNAYNAPDLVDVVQKGLARLMARGLRFGPDADDLPIQAEILTEDLVRSGHTKHLRIMEALEYIGRTETDWPQPAKVIQVLRDMSRQNRADETKSFPLPTDSKQAHKELQKIRELISDSTKSLTYDKSGSVSGSVNRSARTFTTEPICHLTPAQEAESRQRFISGGMAAQREYLASLEVKNV